MLEQSDGGGRVLFDRGGALSGFEVLYLSTGSGCVPGPGCTRSCKPRARLQLFAQAKFCETLRAMRARALVVVAAAVWVGAPSAAWADVAHTVAAGESLWSIAQTDGLSVARLAAANGLSARSQLVAGSTLMIPAQEHAAGGGSEPPVTEGNRAYRDAGTGGGTNVTPVVEINIGSIQANIGSRSQYNTAEGSARGAVGTNAANRQAGDGGDLSTTSARRLALETRGLGWISSELPEPGDIFHTVASGESLWSIAQTEGLSVARLAAANGLSGTSQLIAGSTLIIPPRQHAGSAPPSIGF
jgi:LysM repeat protein